jgi:hypothetical protein
MASAAAWQPSGAQVFLNVYDLTTEMNSWTYWCGVGVFHAGVEVYGIEYAYGGKHAGSWRSVCERGMGVLMCSSGDCAHQHP